jgi:(1->4)-alpha-D-glucan 1-alpha-D-glucosylmutase
MAARPVSWISPSREYDEAAARFVERTLVSSHAAAFLAQFLPFQRRVAYFGMLNALAQLTLKIASPGVPDFYQGTELWDLTLVDPDNRRPIDFTRRIKWLEEIEPCLDDAVSAAVKGQAVEELLAHWHDGRIKLYLTAAGLRQRRQRASLFLRGEYLPLAARGAKKNHVVACGRRHHNSLVLAVVPRLVVSLTDGVAQLPVGQTVWGESWLVLPGKPGCTSYRNVFTGESIRPVRDENGIRLQLGDVFRICPVALLIGGLEGEPSGSA